jgi:hypothetical protein
MKSEFDYGEVIDNVDLMNAFGSNNMAPMDPLGDNMVGIGMPVTDNPATVAVPNAQALKKATNLKIMFVILAIIVVLYLAYKRDKDNINKKSNPMSVDLIRELKELLEKQKEIQHGSDEWREVREQIEEVLEKMEDEEEDNDD